MQKKETNWCNSYVSVCIRRLKSMMNRVQSNRKRLGIKKQTWITLCLWGNENWGQSEYTGKSTTCTHYTRTYTYLKFVFYALLVFVLWSKNTHKYLHICLQRVYLLYCIFIRIRAQNYINPPFAALSLLYCENYVQIVQNIFRFNCSQQIQRSISNYGMCKHTHTLTLTWMLVDTV